MEGRKDRLFFFFNHKQQTRPREVAPSTANLVSSLLTNAKHSPCIDLDFEARLEPSSTIGHYHLYLDGLEMDWDKYKNLLLALAEAGVIQSGYAQKSIQHKASFLRPPWIKKSKDGLLEGYDFQNDMMINNQILNAMKNELEERIERCKKLS